MLRRALVSLIAAGSLGAAWGWQAAAPVQGQPQSLKGVVLKKKAPVSREMLRVKMPHPVERKLKNGLTLLVLENRRLPVVSIDLVLSATTMSDPPGVAGVAEATAALLKAGAGKRDARQIAERLSELGANLNVVASYGSRATHVYASTLTENLDALLEMFGDVLLRPTFPQDELDKWKKRRIGELQQQRASEFFLGNERLLGVLYEGDARAIAAPAVESVEKITRDHLVEYRKSFYRPGNSLLGITGDVKPAEIAAKMEKLLADWEKGSSAEPDLPLKPPIQTKGVHLVNRPNSVQTFLTLGNRAIHRTHPDYIPCLVLNQVLGDGPASRLFRNIREEKGYTYMIYSSFTALHYRNHFGAVTTVRSEVTKDAVDELLREFKEIRESPVPEEELDNARRAIVASFALELENQNNVLRQILLLREYGLPEDYFDVFPAKVMAVTADQVQQMARKYVPVDNVQLIAVGEAAKIRDVLAKYGPVVEYTTDGKRVTP